MSRTRNYVRQIGGSLLFKACAVGISFLALPLMIRYLGQELYGVWSTLLGVISWAAFFDLGIGNGLRNKVAEALAKQRRVEAAHYISSAYTLIAAIAILLWLAIIGASFFVSWRSIFNTSMVAERDLRITVQIVASFMLLNFWIGLIGALIFAIQKTAMISAGQLISNLVSFTLIWTLLRISHPSIVYLAWVFGIAMVGSNVVLSAWFFSSNRDLRPRVSFAANHLKPIMSLGVQFFVIQISSLVLFTTDKLLIAQFFGPENVTHYDVVFKLFSIITFLYALVTAPLWSAYTDAYHKDDLPWIRRMLRRQLGVFLGFVVIAASLAVMTKPIAELWVGPAVKIDQSVVLAMAVFIVLSTWSSVFSIPLVGMGKIRLSSLYTAVAAAMNVPLAYGLAVVAGLGVPGIVVATAISGVIGAIIGPLQIYYFVFARKRVPSLETLLR